MEYIVFGQIVNTHGLKGHVKINIFSENVQNIKNYEKIYLKENEEYIECSILDLKFSKNQAITLFKGINNKDEADTLRNKYICIKKDDLEALEDNTYYLIDLLGLDVYEKEKDKEKLLGKLVEVNQNAPTDIYVIQTEKNHSIMVPAIKEYIKKVDMKNKKIVVDLSEYSEYEI